jgi:hypothetical protein
MAAFSCKHLLFIFALFQILVGMDRAALADDKSELVKGLLFICVGGGSEEKLAADGKGDVALTLKALRTGNLGVSGGAAANYSSTEWQGLIGGINAGITSTQAQEADKVRDCLAPYRAGIVQQMMNSGK